jgi:hypothetical protein
MARGAQAYRNSAQSIPNNTFTAISWSSANFDTDVFWSAVNPTRLTVPGALAGQFIVILEVQWASSATGFREILIRKNGTTTIANLQGPAEAAGSCEQILTTLCVLAAGDYIEGLVDQLSGGALNVAFQTAYTPTMSIVFQGS